MQVGVQQSAISPDASSLRQDGLLRFNATSPSYASSTLSLSMDHWPEFQRQNLVLPDGTELGPDGEPVPKRTRYYSADHALDTWDITTWIWRGTWFPRKKVCLFVGDGGLGKSAFMLRVAAEVAAKGESVVYFTGEDDLDTVGARLAGLDVPRGLPLYITHDLGDHDWKSAGMVVVDPIIEMLSGRRSSNQAEDVRAMLNELLYTSATRFPALVGLHHRVKRPEQLDREIDTVLGSGAWTQKMRQVIMTRQDKDEEDVWYAFKAKSNITATKGVLTLRRSVVDATASSSGRSQTVVRVDVVAEDEDGNIEEVAPPPAKASSKRRQMVEYVARAEREGLPVDSAALNRWFADHDVGSNSTRAEYRALLDSHSVGFGAHKVTTYTVLPASRSEYDVRQ